MQTLSKAFGLAGIRLGAAFASEPVAALLNNLKAPYNISSPTSALAIRALQPASLAVVKSNIAKIVAQRERLLVELPKVPGVGRFVGGVDANFLLVEMLDGRREEEGRPSNEVALAVYERLAETRGVVVRFRGKEVGCMGCLRVTVGTEKEIEKFLKEIRKVLEDVLEGKVGTGVKREESREQDANGVVA